MSRIDAAFSRLRREKGKALLAFLTVGFPSVAVLPDLAKLLSDEGVDILELGIPFSDPLADGPTIQATSSWALERGVSPRVVLKNIERLRRRLLLPIALLTYFNPVARYGVKAFCRDSLESGVDGLIVPDLPPEEAQELIEHARPLGLNTIFLAAPTSPSMRLKAIAQASTGFIYYVSLTGVTGARGSLSPDLLSHVRIVKRLTRLPVCVGFGISRPDQVRQVVRIADGAIVGSALLDLIGKKGGGFFKPLAGFVRSLRRACRPS